jgi:fluoride ion exporter CrcB/FEX
MKAVDQRSQGIILAGIVAGSFAGAVLRGALSLVAPIHSESAMTLSLILSILGGALLGTLLGIALKRRASSVWQLPLVVALIAAIGSFGAAAAVELVATDAAPWPFWRDAALNIGVTVLTARAAVLLIRRHQAG